MTKSDTPSYFQANQSNPSFSQSNTSMAITWTAPDSVKRVFSVAWYLNISLFFIGLIVVSIWWLDSIITAVLFVVVYIALIIYTKKSPQIVNYSLSDDSLSINNQVFKLENFSSFSIIEDHELYSIVLLPSKRLATSLTITFSRADGEAIVDFLGAAIPMKPFEENLIDKLIRRLGL